MDNAALESVWSNLLDHAPYSFVCLDAELKVEWCTSRFSDVTPANPGDVFVEGLDPFTVPRVDAMFDNLAKADEPDSHEITLHHRQSDGHSLPVDYTWVTCRDAEGAVTGYLGMGRTPGETKTQVQELQDQVAELLNEREQNSKELKRLRARAENHGDVDSLTGLQNRSFILERLENEVARAIRYDEPMTILLIDIDHLARVNEEYNTSMGDEVIREVAACISDQVRDSDMVARFDGEQFMVLTPHTDRASSQFLAERLRRRIAELSFNFEQEDFGVTVSTGMVTVQGGNQFEVDAILRAVEAALESAKNSGMNRVSLLEAP